MMTLLLPIVYLYLQNSSDKPMKKEYEEEELQAAASALALMVLRIRDGKTRDTVANGVLRALTRELMLSARSEGGYPDSDDEEDDDDKDDDGEREDDVREEGGVAGVVTEAQLHTRQHLKTSVFMK